MMWKYGVANPLPLGCKYEFISMMHSLLFSGSGCDVLVFYFLLGVAFFGAVNL